MSTDWIGAPKMLNFTCLRVRFCCHFLLLSRRQRGAKHAIAMPCILLELLMVVAFAGTVHAGLVFRCPSCSAERQAECPALTAVSCAEIVREPGCGCCPVCARRAGDPCGVYTPRCASGLRCYPEPDSELPLDKLVRGLGRCAHKAEAEPSIGSAELSGEVLAPESEQTEVPPIRRPTKDSQWMGPKESAVIHHRQQMKTKMKYIAEDPKVQRTKLSRCQQELEQVLEKISKMPFRDNHGPLEDLYSVHIPNCDKRGQYNLKQCKMSVNGHRGECWCVTPHTGRHIQSSPVVRGEPNCSHYINALEMEPPSATQG
ncbi:insulin-like growth factor-binding protein 2-A precursor [Silurus asotus]|uniref:Insulin-like growth factor-binding protein 2-A n=1 Tax=Silurus asotus TaxID=30991 RepID=A0AAD5ACV7_SILAS|nr:insulin-like growth factor-binding protein 2-A precursor [Silurus asotus]